MTTCLDVAEFILQQKGPVSPMKLQKLVYYSQAWSLAIDNEPLFEEEIEAWKNGPVVRKLLEHIRNQEIVYSVSKGDPEQLDEDSKDTIISVIIYYGQKSGKWLQQMTHSEDPWIQSREKGEAIAYSEIGIKGNFTIHQEKMREYYSRIGDMI